jgi:hypothetical protein
MSKVAELHTEEDPNHAQKDLHVDCKGGGLQGGGARHGVLSPRCVRPCSVVGALQASTHLGADLGLARLRDRRPLCRAGAGQGVAPTAGRHQRSAARPHRTMQAIPRSTRPVATPHFPLFGPF